MPEHVPSTMHVFRGEKYRLLLRGSDTKDRKGNGQTYLTVKDSRPLTPYGSPDKCPQADTFWREKRRRSSQPSPRLLKLYRKKLSKNFG